MTDQAVRGSVRDFYSRIATPYDLFASSPIFARLRRRAVETLDLSPGDSVLEIGCGTGGNLPVIDRALEGRGSYVGIDASPGMLRRARRRRTEISSSVLQGDATAVPLAADFDAILVTFVNGVLQDPGAAVEHWVERLDPGGRITLLDAAARPGRSTPLDWGFEAFVYLAAPPGTRRRAGGSANERLVERVAEAHRRLESVGAVSTHETRWFGFVRLTTATIE